MGNLKKICIFESKPAFCELLPCADAALTPRQPVAFVRQQLHGDCYFAVAADASVACLSANGAASGLLPGLPGVRVVGADFLTHDMLLVACLHANGASLQLHFLSLAEAMQKFVLCLAGHAQPAAACFGRLGCSGNRFFYGCSEATGETVLHVFDVAVCGINEWKAVDFWTSRQLLRSCLVPAPRIAHTCAAASLEGLLYAGTACGLLLCYAPAGQQQQRRPACWLGLDAGKPIKVIAVADSCRQLAVANNRGDVFLVAATLGEKSQKMQLTKKMPTFMSTVCSLRFAGDFLVIGTLDRMLHVACASSGKLLEKLYAGEAASCIEQLAISSSKIEAVPEKDGMWDEMGKV